MFSMPSNGLPFSVPELAPVMSQVFATLEATNVSVPARPLT